MKRTARRWFFIGKIWLLLVAVRLGLSTLPYGHVQRLLRAVGRPVASPSPAGANHPRKVAAAVALAARFVPGASCLTQALGTEVLLRRAGLCAAVRIGVRRSTRGQLEAHAWVEAGGTVVIGGGELEAYEPFPATIRQSR